MWVNAQAEEPPMTGNSGGSHGGPELTEPRANPGPAPPSTARGKRGGPRAERGSGAQRHWPGLLATHAEDHAPTPPSPSFSTPVRPSRPVPAGSLGGRVRIAEAGRMWTLELDRVTGECRASASCLRGNPAGPGPKSQSSRA